MLKVQYKFPAKVVFMFFANPTWYFERLSDYTQIIYL